MLANTSFARGREAMTREIGRLLKEDVMEFEGRRVRFESAAVADERARIAAALRLFTRTERTANFSAANDYSRWLADALEEGRL
jgi:stage III sporulation protein SpoIIIAA